MYFNSNLGQKYETFLRYKVLFLFFVRSCLQKPLVFPIKMHCLPFRSLYTDCSYNLFRWF